MPFYGRTGKDARFVHSKTWLIDDVWFYTGSANLNERSFFVDQELGAAVVDEETVMGPDGFEVGAFALNARARMWAEMAGSGEADVAAFLAMPLKMAVASFDWGKASHRHVTANSPPMSLTRRNRV